MGSTASLSKLREDTGQSTRFLGSLCDAGILQALPDTDKQGKGNHRVFSTEPYYGERALALIATALHQNFRLPLANIKWITSAFRYNPELKRAPFLEGPEAIERAVRGERVCVVVSFYQGRTVINLAKVEPRIMGLMDEPLMNVKMEVWQGAFDGDGFMAMNLDKVLEPLR